MCTLSKFVLYPEVQLGKQQGIFSIDNNELLVSQDWQYKQTEWQFKVMWHDEPEANYERHLERGTIRASLFFKKI